MSDVRTVLCRVRNETIVDVLDEYGNVVDILSFPCPVHAQSFGNGITVSLSNGTTHVYTLQDGRLMQSNIFIS